MPTPAALQIDVCAAHGAFFDRGEAGAIWAETSVRAAELEIAGQELREELDAARRAEIHGALDFALLAARA